MTLLVTGGAGFIGANFILEWLAAEAEAVVNLDQLTYAGNLENLAAVERDERYRFVHGDIADRGLVKDLLREHRPRAILNFAAETHVDRSIAEPGDFVETNVVGTFHLLDEVLDYWRRSAPDERETFRFLHVSTDEVYGSLGTSDAPFKEASAYAPNSPYAASKAAADHLVRAYRHTYGLPVLTTNCSNNYGPYQFPEKLIPLVILNALQGEPIPVYGDGGNVRDWLYVADHCSALRAVLARGRVGETYNVGGNTEYRNIDVVHAICALLDELVPDSAWCPHARSIRFVEDRPGHDRRYAIDSGKIGVELGWSPTESFASGLRNTAVWYLAHAEWCARVRSGAYRAWIATHYAAKLAT